MPRLLVQADDNGISRAATLGILEAVERGLVRNTGLFANTPASPLAAELFRDRDDVCVGQDINFVTGRPLLHPSEVPALVTSAGAFRTSGDVVRSSEVERQEGFVTTFAVEPFPIEQARAEARAQVQRFVDLVGRPPAYLHHHSVTTLATEQVVRELAAELSVPVSLDVLASPGVHAVPNTWYARPFGIEQQAAADAVGATLDALREAADHELSVFITHPGYVDGELLDASSFSVVRARDLQMLCAAPVADAVRRLGFEIVRYDDL